MQEPVSETTVRGLPFLTASNIEYRCPFCLYTATLADAPAHRATPEHKRLAK